MSWRKRKKMIKMIKKHKGGGKHKMTFMSTRWDWYQSIAYQLENRCVWGGGELRGVGGCEMWDVRSDGWVMEMVLLLWLTETSVPCRKVNVCETHNSLVYDNGPTGRLSLFCIRRDELWWAFVWFSWCLKYFEMLWDALGCSGMLWDALSLGNGRSETCWREDMDLSGWLTALPLKWSADGWISNSRLMSAWWINEKTHRAVGEGWGGSQWLVVCGVWGKEVGGRG